MTVSTGPAAASADGSVTSPRGDTIITEKVLLVRPLGMARKRPVHWSDEALGEGEASASFRALEAGLAREGFAMSDVIAPEHYYGGGLHEFRFPRNVAWTKLPVIEAATPFQRYTSLGTISPDGATVLARLFGSSEEVRFKLHQAPGGVLDDIGAVERVVVDAAYLDDDILWNGIGSWYRTLVEKGFPVLWFDGSDLVRVEERTVRDCARRMMLREHLDFNFSLNFTLMLGRAFAVHAREVGLGRKTYQMTAPRLGGYDHDGMTPLAIQLLYLIDETGPAVEVPINRPSDHIAQWAKVISGLPGFAQEGECFEWCGSGLHAPWRAEESLRHLMRPEEPMSDIGGYVLSHMIMQLCASGKLTTDENGRAAVTKKGRRLLEILGRSAADPDLPLRWRDGEPGSRKAVDRWINKAFRKMKRRLAHIPASTFIEDQPDERQVKGNRRLVFGAKLDVGRMRESIGQLPLEERTRAYGMIDDVCRKISDGLLPGVGLLFDRPFDRQPSAIWYGVPVGIVDHAVMDLHGAGWYSGLDDLDARVEKIGQAIPSIMKRYVSGHPRRVFSIEETSDESYLEGPARPSVTFEERIAHGRILLGLVCRSADHLNLDDDFCTVVRNDFSRLAPFGGENYLVSGLARHTDDSALYWQRALEIGHVREDGSVRYTSSDPGRIFQSLKDCHILYALRRLRTELPNCKVEFGFVVSTPAEKKPSGRLWSAPEVSIANEVMKRLVAFDKERSHLLAP